MKYLKVVTCIYLLSSSFILAAAEPNNNLSFNRKKFIYSSKGILKENNINVKNIRIDKGNVVFYIDGTPSDSIGNLIGSTARLVYEEGTENLGVNKKLILIIDYTDGSKTSAFVAINQINQLGKGKIDFKEFSTKIKQKTFSKNDLDKIRKRREGKPVSTQQKNNADDKSIETQTTNQSSSQGNIAGVVNIDNIKAIKTSCDKQFREIDQLVLEIKNTNDPAQKSSLARKIKGLLTDINIKAMRGFSKGGGDTLSLLKAYFYQAYYGHYLEYQTDVTYLFEQVIAESEQKLKSDKNLSASEKQSFETLINESIKARNNKPDSNYSKKKIGAFKNNIKKNTARQTQAVTTQHSADQAFCSVISGTYNKIAKAQGAEKTRLCQQSIQGFDKAIAGCTSPKNITTLQACLYYKAQCYKELGDRTNYKQTLEKVVKMYPDPEVYDSEPQTISFMNSLRENAQKELKGL